VNQPFKLGPLLDSEMGRISGPSASHSVGRLAFLSFVAVALDRAAALLLVVVIAALLGATHQSDLYFLALVVPTAAGGALSDSFYTVHMPIFTRRGGAAWPILAASVRRAAIFAGSLTVFYIVVLLITAPRTLSVWLIAAPILFTMSLSGVYAAFFVAQRRYTLAVLRVPLATSMALVLVVLFIPLSRSAGVLATSMSAANLAVLGLLVLRSFRAGGEPEPQSHEFALGSSRRTIGSIGSTFAASIVGGPLVVIVERALASALATGAVALLTFSRNLATAPGLIPNALASGIFPSAAVHHARSDRNSFAKLMFASIRVGALVALVSIAFLLVSREEIVKVALEHGALDEEQARSISHLLALFSWSLIGTSLLTFVDRALFAMERYRLVAMLNITSLFLYVTAATVLRSAFGIDGLAAAFSLVLVTTGVAAAALLVFVLKLSPSHACREWAVLPLLLATVFAAGAYVGRAIVVVPAPTVWQALEVLLVSLISGTAALAAAISLLRTREYIAIRSFLRRRRAKTPASYAASDSQPPGG
jgi:peptidoglycan biosynthesis protein MviN/MurJ (putative lipid II flippase)